MVSVPRLLVLGGLARTVEEGWSAIRHGQVSIEQWCIGLAEGTLPRWVLRGVTVTRSGRSMQVSEDGTKILGIAEAQLR